MEFASINLSKHLDLVIPKHATSEIYGYMLFPAGKLFRPKLCYATAIDLAKINQSEFTPSHNVSFLASAIEMHHVYTLIHDDLPCMDDDDMRRGRPSAHRQFNEWMAVLAGDGLLNGSHYLMSKIDHPRLRELLQFSHWATGAKGLILGQMMDLNLDSQISFRQQLEVHRLKTSRLIQVALVGGTLLSAIDKNLRSEWLKSYRLGNSLGILFQLIDDLSELTEDLNTHEQNINPWMNSRKEALKFILYYAKTVANILRERPETSKVMKDYISSITKKMASNTEAINQKTENNFYQKSIHPILASFNSI
ncbi:MAG: polyprenyl synthetase family protein [Bdellovibrio sp.]